MKLYDYLAVRLMAPNASFLTRFHLVVWAVWALLVKPRVFLAPGPDGDVEVDMEVRGGMLRLLFSSLLMIGAGVGLCVATGLGTAILLVILVTTPLWVPVLYLVAALRAWLGVRRHKRALAEARGGLKNSN